ncbi:hypothetical protein CIK05_07365 [Bdellovibrio sp. qaytius]|nr:hypothetical protein CIK05_07365 [Bdellovibrio sp. qaytius]
MFNLEVFQLQTAQEFLNVCSDILYQKEAEYSLMLGLSEISAKLNKNAGLFYIVKTDSQISGIALATSKNIIISDMTNESVLALADQLYFDKVNFPGVVGPVSVAALFAKTWAGLTENKTHIAMSQKIYKLDKVILPRPVDGQLIVANLTHQDLITQWVFEFSLESLPHEANSIDVAREFAVNKIAKGEVFIWLDGFGIPVSMDATSRPTKNGVTVNAVYTPKTYRKKGYASALVASTSQLMLNSGKKFCVLYTDLANPTSNKIYQDIGYNEIATSVNYIFT